MTSRFLNVEPPELRFTYELNRQATCILRLSNNSQYPVAFKVMTTDPRKYAVRPNIGVLNSLSACDVSVIMLGPRDILPDMQCRDKFLIKSVIANPWTTTEDAGELFKEPWRNVEDFKVKVVYVYPPEASNHQRSQVKGENGVDFGDLIMKILKIGLLAFVVWFLVMKMLPAIWSLTFFITMLVVKMINKVISDSVEEWMLKILCYIFVQYFWGILRHIGKLLKLVQ